VIIPKACVAAAALLMIASGCSSETQMDASKRLDQPQIIILQADGLARPDGTLLHYGSDIKSVTAMIERFGPVDQHRNTDCGAGPMAFVASPATGLTANFQNDQLVGWFYDGNGRSARLVNDISVGSTYTELSNAMPVEMQADSTLGVEFFAGDPAGFVGGFLSGQSHDAVVESLYSGTNCFFR